jgi:maleylpyruvate isomerase
MSSMGSTSPPDVLTSIANLGEANTRLVAAVNSAIAAGGHDAFAAPSRLPNWTVGHVVTHLARNADGLRRVLEGARVGEQLQPYDSPQAREDDIQAGALRSTAAIATDFREADHQLSAIVDSLPAETWSFTVNLGRGGPTTADVVLAARLGEVEIHHHDLGVDGGLALLDDAQGHRLLAALLRSYVRTRDVTGLTLEPEGGEPIVIGAGGAPIGGRVVDLVGWLSGRTDGSTLRTSGVLPRLPTW